MCLPSARWTAAFSAMAEPSQPVRATSQGGRTVCLLANRQRDRADGLLPAGPIEEDPGLPVRGRGVERVRDTKPGKIDISEVDLGLI
jgi:hypothetical protein